MRKLANIDIGLCGEYYVCAQMHLKGWTASMTLKNYPGIDILGYNPTDNKRTEIQVKTGQNKYTVLTGLNTDNFNKSIGNITQPYVFVHLLDDDNIECYILTSADFVSLSKRVYSKMNTVTQGKPHLSSLNGQTYNNIKINGIICGR